MKSSPELAYVIGVVEGDGFLSYQPDGNYRIGLNTVDKDFIEKFTKNLSEVVGRDEPYSYHFDDNTGENGSYRVLGYSKALYNFIDKKRYSRIIEDYPKNYVEGIFDSEGCVSQYACEEGIRIFSTEKELLKRVKIVLEGLNIKSTIHQNREDYWAIWIRRKSRQEFLNKIGYKFSG